MKKLLLTLIFMLVAIPAAYASHYDLEDAEFIPATLRKSLIKDNVQNTEDLFALLMTKSGRAAFVKKYKAKEADVDFLAHELELMQIRGIGPKAATLLLKSGVENVKALSKAHAGDLLETLLRTNRELNITGVQPDLAVVTDWIENAKKVTNHIE